jgi:hypothetical protein
MHHTLCISYVHISQASSSLHHGVCIISSVSWWLHWVICTISVMHEILHLHVASSLQTYISTVYYIHDYIPSIAFWVGAFYHYFLIALVQIGMFYNQHHPNYSGNKLWARMFQTSLINLSNYPHLLSMSFVMILALWEFDHLFLSYLVKLIYVQSLHALVILISSCSRHQPQSSLVWLLFATFDV